MCSTTQSMQMMTLRRMKKLLGIAVCMVLGVAAVYMTYLAPMLDSVGIEARYFRALCVGLFGGSFAVGKLLRNRIKRQESINQVARYGGIVLVLLGISRAYSYFSGFNALKYLFPIFLIGGLFGFYGFGMLEGKNDKDFDAGK